VGTLTAFGTLNNETFDHNMVYLENEGCSDVRFVQINEWPGDSLVKVLSVPYLVPAALLGHDPEMIRGAGSQA